MLPIASARCLVPEVLSWLLMAPAFAGVIGPLKQPYQDLPEDQARMHVETIDASRHTYEVPFRGTVDGTMTRMPIGYAAFQQGWQPNRSVLIENVGDVDVRNPWLVVNGKRNWRTVEDVAVEATRGYTREADRARAIWEFFRHHRFHACTWDRECNDVLKVLNVYGYTLCGNQARVLDDLWRAAGFRTRRCHPIGHVVGEVYYDGAFHMLDSDEHVICLLRDNRTIASAEQIVRDHDLVKRTHTYGVGRREDRKTDEFSASLYVWEGPRTKGFGQATRHSMGLTLRPGESIEYRWDHIGKQYTAGLPLKDGEKRHDGIGDLLAGWGPRAYDNLRNGKLRYRPDLTRPVAARGTSSMSNATFDLEQGAIESLDASVPAHVVWEFAGPYVFVGGRAVADVLLQESASAQWDYSANRQTWLPLQRAEEPGHTTLEASLDDVLSPRKKPTYRFWLRLTLHGQASVADVLFDNDIQTSALGLPELEIGANRILYADTTDQPHRVRVTHRWMERASWHCPTAPEAARFPKDGATVSGTCFTFRWTEATDPDHDRIADYHFQLSEHSDMRWPLSPTFEKLTSKTRARGGPDWTIPAAGLLNPGTTYFWRVRACDATGVWGPWSRPFSFRAVAPGVPVDLRLVPDTNGGLILQWHANSNGTKPVAYKVYGSNEKGFSVSDEPYDVFRGKGFVSSIREYDSKPSDAPDAGLVRANGNLICRVSDTHLRVVGPELTRTNTNMAFYRVVAVDASGIESGPSDYVEVARPFVVTQPRHTAQVGKPFTYQPRLIQSIGDLRCRRSETSSYNAAYWDREVYSFAAASLPPGLSLDSSTGLVSGTPSQTGRYPLSLEVSDQSGHSKVVTWTVEVVP